MVDDNGDKVVKQLINGLLKRDNQWLMLDVVVFSNSVLR